MSEMILNVLSLPLLLAAGALVAAFAKRQQAAELLAEVLP